MRKRFLDAMTFVQDVGKPDIFLTMTCNPNWPEIVENLYEGQTAQHRPDLVTRVFRAKLEYLKHQLFTKHILGVVASHIYVIEFQKQGLPHAHFLLIMTSAHKLANPDHYDKGHDKQVVNVDKDGDQVVNEINRFQDARYVSPLEAMWRIYGFPLSNIYPSVMSLQVHLPNNQLVRFREDDVLTDILNREINKRSMLTAFFELNKTDPNARQYLYRDIPRRVFIDGPGGTGKTFLYKALLANVRSCRLIVLSTASLGAAANNMTGGRTANSRFKIPINLTTNSMCNIKKQSGPGKLLCQAKLIIWDEASMAKRQAVEAVDRTMQDITGVKLSFGGKIMVLGGGFRQILPVVRRGT
nr:ATP-dependent DNA helicase PIF1-like [Tanacetum cinerariifolium]